MKRFRLGKIDFIKYLLFHSQTLFLLGEVSVFIFNLNRKENFMKKMSYFAYALILVAVTLAVIAMGKIEAEEFAEVRHYVLPIIASYFFSRYILKKEAMATIRELARMAYERSPKNLSLMLFRRDADNVLHYLTTAEKYRYRRSQERLGLR